MARGPFQTSVLLGTETVELAPDASVEVRRSSDGALVQLYDAFEDGNTVGNPAMADSEGFVRVWAEADTYDITITNGSMSRTLERLTIVDYQAATGRNAIVESGSNDDGSYTRYADGTQICCSPKLSFPASAEQTPSVTWTYPAEFVGGANDGNPSVTASLPPPAAGNFSLTGTDPGLADCEIGIYRSTAQLVVSASAIAIGRWK